MLFLFLFQCLSFAHVFPVSQNNGLIRPNLCLSNLQRLCANSELVLPFGVPPEAFMCLHFELCHVVGLCSVASNKIVFVMCNSWPLLYSRLQLLVPLVYVLGISSNIGIIMNYLKNKNYLKEITWSYMEEGG